MKFLKYGGTQEIKWSRQRKKSPLQNIDLNILLVVEHSLTDVTASLSNDSFYKK
jgi:hypothetical protein